MKYGEASAQDFFNSIYSAFIRVERGLVWGGEKCWKFSATVDFFTFVSLLFVHTEEKFQFFHSGAQLWMESV